MDTCTLIEIGTAIFVPVALAAFVLFFSGREKLGAMLMIPSLMLFVFPMAKFLLMRHGSMSCETALNVVGLGVVFYCFICIWFILVKILTSG